jgi:hypothetical protein
VLALAALMVAPVSCTSSAGQAAPPTPNDQTALHVIPVKILVDEEQRAVQQRWEERLRRQVARASELFETNFRVRFAVIAADQWRSDDSIRDFVASLKEFEQKASLDGARLAIGFTSQYRFQPGPLKLGGIRGPLATHLLIRDWPQHYTETEQREVLIHELGHYLGAVHSPAADSAMRPVLGDGKARSRQFTIQFDPLNTFVLYLVAEDLRRRPIRGLVDLSTTTKELLREAYADAARILPGDDTAVQYAALLTPAPVAASAPTAVVVERTPLRSIVQAITAAAERNRQLPTPQAVGFVRPYRLDGDELTDYYVRSALSAGRSLPDSDRHHAILVGLGIALDDSDLLRSNVLTRRLWTSGESDAERRRRQAVLGTPTMWNRRDLAQHFMVSAALAAHFGPTAAELAGIQKEVQDAQQSSGFSFVDLAADLAGIEFARRPLAGALAGDVESTFRVADYFPKPAEWEEGLSWKDFTDRYSATADQAFRQRLEAIRQTIITAPAYRRRN